MGLIAEGFDDFRMAMSLIHCLIGGQKIEIAFAFTIPHEGTFSFGQDNGQRMVVVRAVFVFQLHGLFAGCNFFYHDICFYV